MRTCSVEGEPRQRTKRKGFFSRLLEAYPRLARNALDILAARVREGQERYRELATERAEQRIAHALLRLAGQLTTSGRRVGLITNDQSHGLVDTSLVTARGYPVQEITGGCFCCKFGDLVAATQPRWMRVTGDFLVRGGIHTVVVARHPDK